MKAFRLSIKNIFISMILAISVIFLITGQAVLAAETVNIFTTNDIHGNVEATDTNIGIAQTAAIASSNENSVLLDAGDATQGASFASVDQGEDVIKLMNAAGYKAMAAGNHEFDYGVDQLLKNVELANFPIISANVTKDGDFLLNPTTVVESAGKRIGLIGITTKETASSTNPSKLQGISFEDEISAAKTQIAKLNDVDTILIISHLGDNDTAVSCTSKKLLDGLSDEEISKIGALIDGHSHTEEDEVYQRGNHEVPVIQTGCYLTKVGHIALTFNDDGTISNTKELLDYDTAKNYALNSVGQEMLDNVNNTLDEIKKSQDTVLNQVICQNSTPLWGGYVYYDYAEPRIVETNYGDFVTDAFRVYGEVFAKNNGLNYPVIGVENGGGISATLNAGEVKRGDILNAFNHGNMVEAILLSPAELYSGIESGLVVTGQDESGMLTRDRVSGSFAQVSGLSYTYDPTRDSGDKITEIVLDNGTQLNRNDTTQNIIMVTNSYVASAFTSAKKLGELSGEDMIVQDYLMDQTENGTKPLNVAVTANRVKIANDQSPEKYTVTIPIQDNTDPSEDKRTIAGAVINLSIDGGENKVYHADSSGNVSLELDRGPHYVTSPEAADNMPVYVNNYSGSGTKTTKTGYYKLGFFVNPDDVKAIPTESVSIKTSSNPLYLSTNDNYNTVEIEGVVNPQTSTDAVNWSSSAPEVVGIVGDGNKVSLRALGEGEAVVTFTSGTKMAELHVTVSDKPVLAQTYVVGEDSDHFRVSVKNAHVNPAFANSDVDNISIYAWSEPDQSDIAAVHATKTEGTNDWNATFTVNGVKKNTYFDNASDIKIHVYASTKDLGESLIETGSYDYSNTNNGHNLLITPYAQNIGFITPTTTEGEIAGTVGENRHLEGIRIDTPINGLEINYSVHAQDIGWLDPVTSGVYTGTMNQNRQLEAIRISLSGEQAENYSVKYQVHVQNIGWMDWVSDGETAGTTGQGRQIEAVRIQLVEK